MAPTYKFLAEVEPASSNKSPVYAASPFRNATLLADDDITLYSTFRSSVERWPDNHCLGRREVNESGDAGPYTWWTYRETGERVDKLAAAMKGVGLQRGNKIGVFSINCPEWMVTMQACNRMTYTCVPLYDTLGENAIEYIINHAECSAVFVDGVNLDKIEASLPKVKGYVKHVVYWGTASEETVASIRAMKIGITAFDAFMEEGAGKNIPADPPSPKDIATIMYTSGTTGNPKGVVLSHYSLRAGVESLKLFCDSTIPQDETDRYISYLPLAHIFDRMGEEYMLELGASIGYWQGSITKLVDDIGELKPTLFIGVPRVFDRIYSRVKEGVDSSNFIKKFLFNYGFNRKSHAMKSGISQDKASPFFDRLVFSKIKERLGGHVKLIITGGAPIAPHTEEFLKVCFCAPVAQGYGLTETCAGSFITLPDDPTMDGTVGPPLPYVQFCLESVPEMNYDANGNVPAGEVCIRGPTVYDGYHKAKDMTAEVLEENGWFHTGDVGTITPEGSLKIIDRKKNILKLSQGEYVSLEKVEGAYKEDTAVEQIWVYGDSFQNYLVAVVVPSERFVEKWAGEKGKSYDYAELCKDTDLKSDVQGLLNAKAKEQKLKGFEYVRGLHLESNQFSVDNDLITPTFKLKRPQLRQKYQTIVDTLYANTTS